MGDSQQPKPLPPRFEVPDLDLEPVRRAKRAEAALPKGAHTPDAPAPEPASPYLGPNLFDDDAFSADGPSIDLGVENEHSGNVHFGAGEGFDALGGLELDSNAQPELALDPQAAPHSAAQAISDARTESAAAWPSAEPPDRARLAIDALEVSRLAAYGEPPKSVHLTPMYAFRVFTRQRELRRELRALEAEHQQAEAELEDALAELGRAVRPEAQRLEQFRRWVLPLIELEEIASLRGQALSALNAELTAQAGVLDAELVALGDQLIAEQARERDAQRLSDEREAAAQRAEAKLKRAQIEIRALIQVAEQKLGPQGGAIPEPEATQIATLKQRSLTLEPEVTQAKAVHGQARLAVDQASARVGALRQSERSLGRKKQGLVQRYQQELELRGQGLSQSEQAERAALAGVGRAALAARGSLAIPEAGLERARRAGQHADVLLLRCETHERATRAYDSARVAQGVRLACTFAALFVALIALKLAL